MGKLLALLVQVVLDMLQWESHYTPEIWKREMWIDAYVKCSKAVNDKSCYS